MIALIAGSFIPAMLPLYLARALVPVLGCFIVWGLVEVFATRVGITETKGTKEYLACFRRLIFAGVLAVPLFATLCFVHTEAGNAKWALCLLGLVPFIGSYVCDCQEISHEDRQRAKRR
jgi:FtsH-binding integral membrane protein